MDFSPNRNGQVVTSPQESKQDPEAKLEFLLSQLSDELADTWSDRFENKPNDYPDIESRIRAISRVLEHRKGKMFEVENISFEESFVTEEHRKTIIEQVVNVFEKSIAALENPENFLGRGNIAEVYLFGDSPRICFKVVGNHLLYREEIQKGIGNSLSREFQFLKRLSLLEVDGCRAPKPIFYMPGTREGYGMETLNAFNAREVLMGITQLPDLEGFDQDRFSSILVRYVEAMHALGIVHGDLWPRNVMIDKDTLLPRIIDFGRSKDLSSLSDVEQERYKKQDLQNAKSIAARFTSFKKGEDLSQIYL